MSNSPKPWSDSVDDELASGFEVAHKPDDLLEILGLAEELHAKCESGADRIEKLKMAQLIFVTIFAFCLLIIFVAFLELGYLSTPHLFTILTSAIVAVGATGFLYAIMLERTIQRVRHRLEPDRRALFELVRIMRETEARSRNRSSGRHWKGRNSTFSFPDSRLVNSKNLTSSIASCISRGMRFSPRRNQSSE